MLINTLFIIINLFVPLIFSVNEENIYNREPYMWLIFIINWILVFYICSLTYKNRDKINKNIVITLLLYSIIPSTTAGIQILVYGAFLLWPTMAIINVIAYIFLETVSTSTDYLTGLLNRSRIDSHVDYLIDTKKNFGLAIIDLDNFKKINDTFGHINGDKALITFAESLKYGIEKSILIGRYGGDEFIVILNPLTDEELVSLKESITSCLKKGIKKSNLPFDISYSLGYQKWDKKYNYTYEELLNLADQKMYYDKTKH